MNSGSMAGSFCVLYQGVEKEVNSQGAKLKKNNSYVFLINDMGCFLKALWFSSFSEVWV